ncbi:MAG TPA: hypothetical protein VL172_12420 [Kofleriaceae bacterium]|jgi:hypothetical protein|nr:hypothetical protein [Kofleriaceae bacterium]
MGQMLRTLLASLTIVLLAGAAIAACGDDDTTNTNTNTTGAADAGDTIDAGDPAADFCADYAMICGFDNNFGGDPYLDEQDCEDRFNGYTASRQACVIMHVAFAAGGMASLHCTHAEGLTECDI